MGDLRGAPRLNNQSDRVPILGVRINKDRSAKLWIIAKPDQSCVPILALRPPNHIRHNLRRMGGERVLGGPVWHRRPGKRSPPCACEPGGPRMPENVACGAANEPACSPNPAGPDPSAWDCSCVESPIPAALSSACSLCRSSLCAITSSALPTQGSGTDPDGNSDHVYLSRLLVAPSPHCSSRINVLMVMLLGPWPVRLF